MRVILADDHRIVRSGIRWMLDAHDDVEIVGEAESGSELLELLERITPDVVILDLRMPGLGGLDVLPTITGAHPELRVVVLSMHDEPAIVRSAIERGASAYLLKSAGMDEVLAALEAVTSGKSYIQSSLTSQILAEVGAAGDEASTPTLTDRERAVLRLIAAGATTREVADGLDASEATVKSDLQAVFERLDVSTRAEAVAAALRLGLIE